MRTSGNHTPAFQFIYLMANVPALHRWKCGISGKVSRRRRDVSESTFGYVFPVFVVWLPFAYDIEQSIHRVFRRWNRPLHGSGGTEWFSWVAAPFILLAMLGWQLVFLAAMFVLSIALLWLLSGCPV